MAGTELQDEELEKPSTAAAAIAAETVVGEARRGRFIDRLIRDVEKDNLWLLQKMRDRMNRYVFITISPK